MVRNLDLEEQEQLDQLKHFWRQYGNLITWALIAVLSAYAAYNGWNLWQQRQAGQAAALYDELERAAQSKDLDRLQRAFADLQEGFAGATATTHAALLVAKSYVDAAKPDSAQAALAWAVKHSKEPGLTAVARLRLAALHIESKSYDRALEQLSAEWPEGFVGLAHDRRGDVLLAQGKKSDAKLEYEKAYRAVDARAEYRRMIEVKLNGLGVEPKTDAPGAPRS